MRLGNAMQTQRRRSLHIGKTHYQHLEAWLPRYLVSSNSGPPMHDQFYMK